jgi:hypothetical protein
MTDNTRDRPGRQNRQTGDPEERPRRQNRQTAASQEKPKRQNRQYVVELEEESGNARLMYALGALGGVAIGTLLLRAFGVGRGEDAEATEAPAPAPVRRPVAAPPARFQPARLRRPPREMDALAAQEEAVLEAFLGDDALRECGIDVGAISHGIVELSGSVWTRDQAHRAVAVARGVHGVATVVNRMEIEDERGRLHPRDDSDEGMEMSGAEWTGNQVGMGGRRQGRDTDPDRTDDSHHQREEAMDQADRAQFADEGYHERPRSAERDEVQEANRTRFAEDELDNQSPYGQHAVPQGSQDDGPPQTLNSQSRVGEGLKPGTELALEAADVPVKPHGQPGSQRPE